MLKRGRSFALIPAAGGRRRHWLRVWSDRAPDDPQPDGASRRPSQFFHANVHCSTGRSTRLPTSPPWNLLWSRYSKRAAAQGAPLPTCLWPGG